MVKTCRDERARGASRGPPGILVGVRLGGLEAAADEEKSRIGELIGGARTEAEPGVVALLWSQKSERLRRGDHKSELSQGKLVTRKTLSPRAGDVAQGQGPAEAAVVDCDPGRV